MKKIAVISLICIYALATVGFSLKESYCCGKLKISSVAFADGGGKAKCNKGDSNKDDCCKNKFQYFKVRDNHTTAAHLSFPFNHSTDIINCPSLEHIIFASQKSAVAYQSNAPPLHDGVPVYISNCVFLI